MEKLKKFDSSYFRGNDYFEEYVTQMYLVFQPMYIYFKQVADVMAITFITDNLKDCLTKELIILEHYSKPRLLWY